MFVFICLILFPEEGVAQNTTPKKYGKYANSMLVKTRTAATYPKGLKVFTLVAAYHDADEYRNL